MYLLAHVPEYSEVRTFAVERIVEISLLEETFTAVDDLDGDAFPHSLGVHSGPPEHVVISFEPAVADYVRAREWHPSQAWSMTDDALVLSLNVCIDQALRSWILSFGPSARVTSPPSLVREIASQLQQAGAQYQTVRATPHADGSDLTHGL
jgi:predicted DNA-binding transcriptional regulator YafY